MYKNVKPFTKNPARALTDLGANAFGYGFPYQKIAENRLANRHSLKNTLLSQRLPWKTLVQRLALSLMLLCTAIHGQSIVARINSLQGEVDILDLNGKNPQKARIGTPLFENQQLRTGTRSKALLSLADGTRLEVFEFSVINVVTLPSAADSIYISLVVRMLSGKIRLTTQISDFKDKKLLLKTPTLVAAARGTDFSCIATLKEARLAVHSGQVEVANRSPTLPQSVILSARQEVRVLEGREPDRLRFLPPEIIENYLEYYEITKAQEIRYRIRENDSFLDRILRKRSF
ncbi:MAG: FecR family protein [Leptospiraceae bacterium]|nr:FecR family protein [Leptospiraceae bacterium]MDW8306851.1 FecR family protein [Leptospiraceae bacterium]